LFEERKNYPSLTIWILFSVLGGFLGAINPAWFIFNPQYAQYIAQNFGFEYNSYAMMIAGFFISVLFLPAFLSTLMLYPWFFKKISKLILERKINNRSLLFSGFGFGCVASLPTAFFFLMETFIFNFFNDKINVSNIFIIPFGVPFLAFCGVLISFPGMFLTGWFFAYLTFKYINQKGGALI
jgi:hypothetical protein